MDDVKTTDRAAPPGMMRKRKRVRTHGKGITWKWFLVIFAAAALTSLLLVSFAGVFETLEDRSYRPKDIERQYHEMQKMKSAVEKQQSAPDGR